MIEVVLWTLVGLGLATLVVTAGVIGYWIYEDIRYG